MTNNEDGLVSCPVCLKGVPSDTIDQHLDDCLSRQDKEEYVI